MLSNRLKIVADMVTKGNSVADIGTDHGYVPIYLIKNGICPKAYAMDINEGPVKSALNHIRQEGLEDKINVILSDGMEKLIPNMADSVIIAGMGGELIVRILRDSKVNDTVKEFILSPHRDIDLVRRYVLEHNYHIEKERMLKDAGKFYTVMKVKPGKEEHPYSQVEYMYGRHLLREKNPVLKEYLEIQYHKFSKIKETMKENNSRNMEQVEKVLEWNRKGWEMYDSFKYRRENM